MLIDQAIDAFWQCAQQRVPVPPEWIGRLDRDTAYRVQLGVLAHHVRAGDRHVGWKVGLTAKAMQIQQGVHEPVFGFLLASGDRPSGARIPFAELISPGIEKRGDFAADLNVSLADNAQQRFFVTGPAVPVPPGADLAAVSVEVHVNGTLVERALGGEVLGTPAASAAWLANKLAEFGLALE